MILKILSIDRILNCEVKMLTLEDIGFSIPQVPTRDRSIAQQICTPFLIADEFPIEIFTQVIGDHVRFFDEGFNIHNILSLGISFDTPNRWKNLERFFKERDITLHPSGMVEMYAHVKDIKGAFAKFSLALSHLDNWVADITKKTRDKTKLISQAAMAFKAIDAECVIKLHPTITMPTRDVSFDMRVNDKYVDILFVDGVWSHVRKVAGVRLVHPGNRTLGVIDDQNDQKRAKVEQNLAGQMVPAMLFSSLIHASNRKREARSVIF